MALVGKAEGQSDVRDNVDPGNLSQVLRTIPGQPLHFEVTGNGPLKYQPYWEVQDEPFTCFPMVKKEPQ